MAGIFNLFSYQGVGNIIYSPFSPRTNIFFSLSDKNLEYFVIVDTIFVHNSNAVLMSVSLGEVTGVDQNTSSPTFSDCVEVKADI